MSEVGIRALKQNASAVVAQAAGGATVTITDRGRPIAQLTAIARSPLQAMIDFGRVRAPRRTLASLPMPAPGLPLSNALRQMRDAERF